MKTKVFIRITHNAELWVQGRKTFQIIKQPIFIEIIDKEKLYNNNSKFIIETKSLQMDITAQENYIKTMQEKYDVLKIKTIIQDTKPKVIGCPIDAYDSQIPEHF